MEKLILMWSGAWQQPAGCAVAVAVAVALCVATWGLYWKKGKGLHLPPGPREVPIFGHWLQIGDQITARSLAGLAAEYGDIFTLRMGRRRLVVVSSPELAKEMMVTKGVEFGSRASNIVFDIFTGSGKDLAFAEYGEHWRKARRMVTVPFFTSKAVERWRGAWEEEVDRLAERMQQIQGEVVVRDSLQLMIYNAMYNAAFGRTFHSEDDPVYRELKHLNDQRGALVQNLDYNYADFHPFLQPLLWGYLRTCRQVKVARERLFKRFISEHLLNLKKGSTAEGTFGIDSMLATIESGEMKEEHVLYILENLNAAGIPTLTSALEWIIAELVNNPDIQEKLHKEIVSVVGALGDLRERECREMPYLQAVIKEGLRYHSSVPLIVPRLNLSLEKLGGYDIPARSKMLLNVWWLANNPRYWHDPNVFNPDRFLTDEGKVEMNGNNFKFLPFGSGRRQCPGITMALPLMHLTIGKLVQKFHLLPSPASINKKLDMSEHHGQFLNLMAVAPKITLRRRN